MNNTLKNIALAVLILFLLSATFAFFQGVRSYARSFESQRTFAVAGQGKIVAIPDVAQFSFSVLTEGSKDVASLQQQNSAKGNSIIEFLKQQGIEAKDIKTQSYSITPRYQYSNCRFETICPPPEIVGYSVQQTVESKIRDFGKISQVLAGVVERGANTVSQISFTIDNPESLKQQAREQAIARARQDAEATAKAGGFKLGRLVSIQEGSSYPYPVPFGMGGAVEAKDAMPSPAIEPGSQEVSSSVTLIYEIK
ncbi:MAG: SIMPL domain-containing protein [Candidatus Wildermuthbacteria bacterium]|nr:SIMPL domain-containing protein [Candidatus Wildermuthbacteria bacterium]